MLPDRRTPLITAFSSYQITSIMEGVIQRGTARAIKSTIPNLAVAGKTGTTNDEKDAWFVGYTPDLLVGVSVGYDTPESMGEVQPAAISRRRSSPTSCAWRWRASRSCPSAYRAA